MEDPSEAIRRQRLIEINNRPASREALEAKYGRVWDTEELAAEFEIKAFIAPMVVVRRRADDVVGTLEFQSRPRFYFSFVEDQGDRGTP